MATTVHKVFVSYHHNLDQGYRDAFEKMFADDASIMVSKSVQIGDIGDNLKTETIRQIIRDKYLSDSTVTIVLIGKETWQRKHVDWEISSSIKSTKNSSRSGLIGILLPTHPSYKKETYDPYIVPPRLYDNQKCGYAKIYNWSKIAGSVQTWIHEAFQRRDAVDPDHSRDLFRNNRSGPKWQP